MAKLILLCGVPASGKSTLANQYESNGEIVLSSDRLREVLSGNAEDQSRSGDVFSIMRTMAEYFLKMDHTVIIDATNTTKKARAGFIAIARQYKALVHAYLFKISQAGAKARNKARARVVPDDVIDRMAAQLFAEPPTVGEVDNVIVVDNNE